MSELVMTAKERIIIGPNWECSNYWDVVRQIKAEFGVSESRARGAVSRAIRIKRYEATK